LWHFAIPISFSSAVIGRAALVKDKAKSSIIITKFFNFILLIFSIILYFINYIYEIILDFYCIYSEEIFIQKFKILNLGKFLKIHIFLSF